MTITSSLSTLLIAKTIILYLTLNCNCSKDFTINVEGVIISTILYSGDNSKLSKTLIRS
jgi:hypothetical protein